MKLTNVHITIAAVAVAIATFPNDVEAQSTASERVGADVRYLAGDLLQGRGVGTAGLDSAAAYLARRFAKAGLTPGGTHNYFQPFRIDSSAPTVAHAGLGALDVKNVVGILTGRGALAHEAVVLGAHYDHLGLGGMGSRDPDSSGVVHNGADDNASGTAALLEAARILSQREASNRRTLVFVAFTAEELGLIGSEHYAKNPVQLAGPTYTMLNFDMVGRLRSDSLMMIGAASAEQMPTLVDSVNAEHGLVLNLSGDPWGSSDHTSFYARKIPVVHFFTNMHSDYHRTTDDWEKINVDGIVRVATFAADVAWALAIRTSQLAFVDVPRPARATGRGYGAYLGTIPDMSGTPGGVRLTGVSAGSPAERAGIMAGDILVQLGEHTITDLFAMTDALRAHKPGDVVKLAVLRDGERIEMTATLGKRGG